MLFDALTSASDIITHLDFYQWLQREMQQFLPHETLAAVWGDFTSGEFHYDLTSSVPGLRTSSLSEARTKKLDQAMYALWQQTQSGERNWKVIRDPAAVAARLGIDISSALFQRFSENIEAILICGLRCNRGREDCLYVFSLADADTQVDPMALDVLISHVDASLRRVETLTSSSSEQVARAAAIQQLSSREKEVLHWVSEGKSNEEIGLILDISHNTVKNHLKRVFAKLGVSARSQAVRLYVSGKSGS
jgi:transcriptional regulator EpsA